MRTIRTMLTHTVKITLILTTIASKLSRIHPTTGSLLASLQ
jgi:hypothetical protein